MQRCFSQSIPNPKFNVAGRGIHTGDKFLDANEAFGEYNAKMRPEKDAFFTILLYL